MRKLTFPILFSLLLVAVAAIAVADDVREARMEDECDVATFPAGSCVGDGNVTFAEFQDELNPDDFGHGAWRFNFGREHIDLDETLVAVNEGGQVHTFTEVAAFGGGCNAGPNNALGLTPVPECADQALVNSTTAAPGESVTFQAADLGEGLHLFMCLIHPWMRSEIEVRDD